MRLVIAISVWAAAAVLGALRADDPFAKVVLGTQAGYIIPESYATAHKADLIADIPGGVKVDGFWTPLEQDIQVAERIFRQSVEDATKDPTLLFPDLAPPPDQPTSASPELEQERAELALVGQNFQSYDRQYIGIIVDGIQLIFCNYSSGTGIDPSANYIFMQKYFVTGKTHFLLCRIDPHAETCTNVSMIGSWKPPEDKR